MSVILIRHGRTAGNAEKRYIGSGTDEPLSAEGAAALRTRAYPPAAAVFSSPMRRCTETSRIIYPGADAERISGFTECDFGRFEGRNYEELKEDPEYLAWLASGGELPFPGGESRAVFAQRCIRAFEQVRARDIRGDIALVVHGGTIMAIMERYAVPAGGYYDFQVPNGEGYVLEENGSYRPLFG